MPGKTQNLEGRAFERLLVIKRLENYVSPNGTNFSKWLCKCVCGKDTTVLGVMLRKGKVRSCGCLRKDTNTKHGGYSNNANVDDIIRARALSGMRDRARHKGYESDLEIEDVPILTDFCPVLGFKYDKRKGGPRDGSPSIDRFNPNLPYLKKYKDNLSFVSYKANRIKSNATLDDLKKIIHFVETRKSHSEGSENLL